MRNDSPSAGAPSGEDTERRLITAPFAVVTATTFVFFLYVGIQVPLIPRLIEEHLGGNEFDVGLNLAAFAIAAIAARPALGRFGDRFGLRLMMMSGATLTCAATVATAGVMNRWMLLPLRGLQGVGEAAMFVGGASLINQFAPAHRRAEAASYFSVAVFGGLGAGPIIGEVVVGSGHFSRGLLVASVFALLGGMGAWFAPRHARPQAAEPVGRAGSPVDTEATSLRQPRYHRAAMGPGMVMALGIAGYTSFAAFMPEHAKDVGLAGSEWVFATYSISCLFIRLVAAKVPERIGLTRAITVALSGLIGGLVVLAVVPGVPAIFVGAVLLAIGMSFQYPSLMAVAVNSVDESERLRVISTFTMFFDVGSVIGGLALGAVGHLTSKRGAFAGGAVLAGCGMVLLYRSLVPAMRAARLHRTPAGPESSAAIVVHG